MLWKATDSFPAAADTCWVFRKVGIAAAAILPTGFSALQAIDAGHKPHFRDQKRTFAFHMGLCELEAFNAKISTSRIQAQNHGGHSRRGVLS